MTLVFDTETSGKADFNAPPEADHQPRLVQLAALLLDSDLHEVGSMNLTIKPVGFTISDEVAKIHGITQFKAEQYGCSEHAALLLFRDWLLMSKRLVAHNIRFDAIVIGRAFHIHQLKVDKMPEPYCTMTKATPLCKLPGSYGNYKWPSLQEAHKILLGTEFTGAHDALADVRACARVFSFLLTGAKPQQPTVTPARPKVENTPAGEYNDDTIMPFGKHRGKPLCQLPDDYRAWLYDQENLSDKRLYRWLHGTTPAAKYAAPDPAPEVEPPSDPNETPLDRL